MPPIRVGVALARLPLANLVNWRTAAAGARTDVGIRLPICGVGPNLTGLNSDLTALHGTDSNPVPPLSSLPFSETAGYGWRSLRMSETYVLRSHYATRNFAQFGLTNHPGGQGLITRWPVTHPEYGMCDGGTSSA